MNQSGYVGVLIEELERISFKRKPKDDCNEAEGAMEIAAGGCKDTAGARSYYMRDLCEGKKEDCILE